MLTQPQGIAPIAPALLPVISSTELFSRLEIVSRRNVIVAISGGSDSTALLLLLKDYIDRHSPATRLVAATVDHALRTGSADEARSVARLCATEGISHRTLTWIGKKPSTGISAAAREARHALLAGMARSEAADLVITGHTANDQAETVLMRQARKSGPELHESESASLGWAGIAPATLFSGDIWFARPLLETRRETLRQFLRQRGMSWIDDPTNENELYERPRLRKRLDDEAIEAALRIAADAGARRYALGRGAAKLIEDCATMPANGIVRLEQGFFGAGEAVDDGAAIHALRILLSVAGGTEHLPDLQRAEALYARLAGSQNGNFRTVLSRTLVDSRRDGVFLLREVRGLPEEMDGSGIWDGRYRIAGDEPDGRNAKGQHAKVSSAAESGAMAVPASLLKLAAACQPDFPNGRATPILPPWRRYLPYFDVVPARAVARLIGAPDIRRTPFVEHIESEP